MMRTLATKFDSKGWSFEQVSRKGAVAIYRKARLDGSAESFELVRINRVKETVFPNGKVTPAHEAFPSAEEWGARAWTFSAASHHRPLESAQKRLDSLLE